MPDEGDRNAVYQRICKKVLEEYPDHTLQVAMDTDFS